MEQATHTTVRIYNRNTPADDRHAALERARQAGIEANIEELREHFGGEIDATVFVPNGDGHRKVDPDTGEFVRRRVVSRRVAPARVDSTSSRVPRKVEHPYLDRHDHGLHGQVCRWAGIRTGALIDIDASDPDRIVAQVVETDANGEPRMAGPDLAVRREVVSVADSLADHPRRPRRLSEQDAIV